MITFDHVTKTYDGTANVVEEINFTIGEGEFFVLIGPSGCGKTTTLKMINRLIPLTKGTIRIGDKRISEYPVHELRRQIGYVLQQIALFPHMTIEENIAIVPELDKWEKARIRDRVTELLTMTGLDPETYRNRKPSELSGGQQQRVGVVRALAADPDIVLMDEPFSALDPISRLKLQEDLLHLQRTIRKTIVFVTHDIQEALKLGDRICIMKDGAVEQLGTPDEILAAPATPFVKEFIGSHGTKPFVLRDYMQPVRAGSPDGKPSIVLDADWSTVLDALQSSDTVYVTDSSGQTAGMLTRSAVFDYLAAQERERTAT
ncbi:glycine/betaine ABC transporter ATP-binding protein [Sporosarcina sp. NCCP-2716]|uniref:ABC transporter ATP-binding protein n=1 Tax=Sporosarcina sp. NCCP-2716 TaxID=2943679 RepID=UPI00203DDBE0|nr:ABC transporter ATP-binding protein [Sporosarcina sp. NCCP-2716]GKV68977.1 glycine/betaine ABC transporter ATP-binding protein [Sporosarcina sp. NCCP-2716]